MAVYQLEVRKRERHDYQWWIKGLPDVDYKGVSMPDTHLVLVGLVHACDTPESVVAAVYKALYDHHQVTDVLQSGDVIEYAGGKVGKYLSFDRPPTLNIPPMRFRVISYHIEQETPARTA